MNYNIFNINDINWSEKSMAYLCVSSLTHYKAVLYMRDFAWSSFTWGVMDDQMDKQLTRHHFIQD